MSTRSSQAARAAPTLAEMAEAVLVGHRSRLGPDVDAAAWLEQESRALAPQDTVAACRLALAAWTLAGQGRTHYPTARSMFVQLGTGAFGPPPETPALESMLAENPHDLVARIALANQHRRGQRLYTAETLCRAALADYPDNPFALMRLASIQAEQGAVESADQVFQAVGARFGGVEAVIRLAPSFLRGLQALTAPDPDPLVQVTQAGKGADFIVLAGGDAAYFHRFADALVNSLARTCRGFGVHFHVVDPDPGVEARMRAMQGRLPGVPITLTVETCPPGLPAEQRKTFYACTRFLHLPRMMAAYGRPILLLDIDMVVLRDVAPLLRVFGEEQADLALVHGETHDPWCTLWADAILIAPTAPAGAFAGLVRDYIGHFIARGQAAWFLDQVALFAAAASGFRGRPAPAVIRWPTDIQNTLSDRAYFWSLHMSQPNNAGATELELYRRIAANTIDSER